MRRHEVPQNLIYAASTSLLFSFVNLVVFRTESNTVFSTGRLDVHARQCLLLSRMGFGFDRIVLLTAVFTLAFFFISVKDVLWSIYRFTLYTYTNSD